MLPKDPHRISRKVLVEQSRRLNKEELRIWLQAATGQHITAAEFEKILRERLPKESFFQHEIMEALKAEYPAAFGWKAAAGPYIRQGIPDVCCVIDGHFFGFEVKRPFLGEPSKIQERTIEEIEQAGGTAAVISFGHQALWEVTKWKMSKKQKAFAGWPCNSRS